MRPGFAVAAEVLEERITLGESVTSLVAAGLAMSLSPSLGAASTVAEDESDPSPFQNTFVVKRDDPEVSTPQKPVSAGSTTVATPAVDTSESEILPAVLDDLLASSLHEPVNTSQPTATLPELPLTEIQESAPRGSFVSSSNSNIGSPAPTGGEDAASFASGTLSARQHGQIQPLAVQSTEESLQTFTTSSLDSGGDSGGSGGESGGSGGEESGGSGGSGGTIYQPGNDDYCDLMTPNNDPVAVADSITTPEDMAVTINVLTNDSDPDGNTIFVTDVTNGANGKATFTKDTVTYTPDENWYGSDQFDYTIKDGHGGEATAAVTITVNSVEDGPIAHGEIEVVGEGGSIYVNILANDSDAEGPVTVDSVDSQSSFGGEVEGTATYDNWIEDSGGSGGSGGPGGYSVGTGWDSFSYQIKDTAENTASATVEVYVVSNAPNFDAPPFSRPDFETTLEDTTVQISPLGNDWDDQGSVTIVDAFSELPGAVVTHDGSTITYTPPENWYGTDTVRYAIQDSIGQFNSNSGGYIEIEVESVNDLPVANDDPDDPGTPIPVWAGASVIIDVLYNDTDVEVSQGTQSLIVTDVTQGAKGKVIFDGESVTYVPNPNKFGTDSFTYQISDGHGGSDTATVNVEIKMIDLDIDSDNNNGYDNPDRSDHEDCIEDDTDEVGKQLIANFGDKDADGIIDYLDGYDLDGIPGTYDDENLQEQFVPLVLEVSDNVDLSVATIDINYDAAGLGVPFIGNLRIWKLDQPNDAQYRTPDDYLAPGTYAASDLGLSNSTPSRTFYVEAVGTSSAIGDEQIAVMIDPDGAGAGGFVGFDQVRAMATGVEIVADSQGDHVVDAADPAVDHVAIGHWGADTNFPAGSAGGAGDGVNGYRADGTLRNNYGEPDADPDKDWDNFIDRDPDRFYVRVTDPAKNLNPNAIDDITVHIGSITGNFAVDDDLTQIQLFETGANTGVFVSVSQLMMSPDLPLADNPDDKFAVHNGLAGGGPVGDDLAGDRTHRTTVDGSVRIRYAGQETFIPVFDRNPEERQVLDINVNVFNEPFLDQNGNGTYEVGEPFVDISGDQMRNTVLGTQAAATASVNAEIARANIAWAQAGIKVELHGNIRFVDAPTDMNGLNILEDREFNEIGDAKIVINKAAGVNFNVLEVYFVAPILNDNHFDNGHFAFSVPPSRNADFPNLGENSFIFIRPGVDLRYRTLAHEIGHVLTNQMDTVTPQHIFFKTAAPPHKDTDSIGAGQNEAFSFRRITHAVETTARKRRAEGQFTAEGNRLLHDP